MMKNKASLPENKIPIKKMDGAQTTTQHSIQNAVDTTRNTKRVSREGNSHYEEDWAHDIASIAHTNILRITEILNTPNNRKEKKAFENFATTLRNSLNNSITDIEIIEMLAQHLLTKPVFETLFDQYQCFQQNTITRTMNEVQDALQEHRLEKEVSMLQHFYDSVKHRASALDNEKAKQRLIIEIFHQFFAHAFPRLQDKLGIVYTPIEAVDFIIHSANEVLKMEFGKTLGDEGIHIIDPFTGTGTFITRLLQSDVIKTENITNKYKNEIHAHELVLLAYYIASMNIEMTYHSIQNKENTSGQYSSFKGISLTDTFQRYQKIETQGKELPHNARHIQSPEQIPIQVIIGNPPYSAGQDSMNDDAANSEYKELDHRIKETYVHASARKGGKRAAYDNYIRAFRWATDRIGDRGIVAFISGSGFIEKPAMDGMRNTLAREFSSIYVLNLRGDIRKNILSKGLAREGENIFGTGCMTGIAITILIKNPNNRNLGTIFYHDIGDALSCVQKREILSTWKSILGIPDIHKKNVTPDKFGDWIHHRDPTFHQHILMGSKKNTEEPVLFSLYSHGIVSNRDPWVYNFAQTKLANNCQRMIDFYNAEVMRYTDYLARGGTPFATKNIASFVRKDTMSMSWGGASWKSQFINKKIETFEPENIRPMMYRPYTKMWHYGGKTFNHSFYSMPQIFPEPHSENIVMCVSGVGARSGFSVHIVDCIPDLQAIDNGLFFPLYVYTESKKHNQNNQKQADELPPTKYTRRSGFTDRGIAYVQNSYPEISITKEDVFFYIYGIFHSPDYRNRYSDNLRKEMPRIPCVRTATDFLLFSEKGRTLAQLHRTYDTVEMFEANIEGENAQSSPEVYRVEKMKYGKKRLSGTETKDLSTIHYNDHITVSNIPEEAYEYIISGKPAIDWVMERQCVKTDKMSRIQHDANDWAIEQKGNPRYPLELLLRVITVSLETMKIVQSLPRLDID